MWLRDSGCVFFFFGYSFIFCRSTKKKKVTRKNSITNKINGNLENSLRGVEEQKAPQEITN